MNIYEVQYFSAIDWKWRETKIIAESQEQVESYINKQCPLNCRFRPYSGEDKDDSLKIKFIESVPLYEINPNWD